MELVIKNKQELLKKEMPEFEINNTGFKVVGFSSNDGKTYDYLFIERLMFFGGTLLDFKNMRILFYGDDGKVEWAYAFNYDNQIFTVKGLNTYRENSKYLINFQNEIGLEREIKQKEQYIRTYLINNFEAINGGE